MTNGSNGRQLVQGWYNKIPTTIATVDLIDLERAVDAEIARRIEAVYREGWRNGVGIGQQLVANEDGLAQLETDDWEQYQKRVARGDGK